MLLRGDAQGGVCTTGSGKSIAEDYEDLTIEEFMEQFVNGAEQRDPLFVTKRFLMYQDSLTKALTEEQNEPPADEEY